MAVVVTIDQVNSRGSADLVPDLLERLAHVPTVRPFERTAGDEVQAVLGSTDAAVDVVLTCLRVGGWSVGIGVGPVEEPLPASTRAGRGDAFLLAREAVEAAKRLPQRVAVRGADPRAAADAEALLTLLATVVERRTDAAWDAVDLLAAGMTMTEAAQKLGVSRQAVSQRLQAALWRQEQQAVPTAARLLAAADR